MRSCGTRPSSTTSLTKDQSKPWTLRCGSYAYTSSESPLHAATADGDVAAVQQLLISRSIPVLDDIGNTPLHVAAAYGNTNVVKLLLERGAPVNDRNTLGLTPLHACCCEPGKDKVGVLQLLLSAGADIGALTIPESQDFESLVGDTALTLAAQHLVSDVDAAVFIRHLLAAGSDPLQPSAFFGTNALEYACVSGDVSVVKELLLAIPKSDYFQDGSGIIFDFYLKLATAYNNVELLCFLLNPPTEIFNIIYSSSLDPTSVLQDQGSSLSAEKASFQADRCISNSPETYLKTVLDSCIHDAIRLDSLPLVKVLVAAGADGCCYLDSPQFYEQNRAKMMKLDAMKRFPPLHALNDAQDFWDMPLNLAISLNRVNIAMWLLKRTNPQPTLDCMNRTALHWAILNHSMPVIKLLLESRLYKQDFDGVCLCDAKDADDWTPLGIALHYRNEDAVFILLSSGVDPNAQTKTREGCVMRPLHKALLLQSPSLVQLLLKFGALIDSSAIQLAGESEPELLELLQSIRPIEKA